MEKVCPLMAMANGIRKNSYSPYCLKENCGWWVEERIQEDDHSSCAIRKIATEIRIIEAQI